MFHITLPCPTYLSLSCCTVPCCSTKVLMLHGIHHRCSDATISSSVSKWLLAVTCFSHPLLRERSMCKWKHPLPLFCWCSHPQPPICQLLIWAPPCLFPHCLAAWHRLSELIYKAFTLSAFKFRLKIHICRVPYSELAHKENCVPHSPKPLF